MEFIMIYKKRRPKNLPDCNKKNLPICGFLTWFIYFCNFNYREL